MKDNRSAISKKLDSLCVHSSSLRCHNVRLLCQTTEISSEYLKTRLLRGLCSMRPFARTAFANCLYQTLSELQFDSAAIVDQFESLHCSFDQMFTKNNSHEHRGRIFGYIALISVLFSLDKLPNAEQHCKHLLLLIKLKISPSICVSAYNLLHRITTRNSPCAHVLKEFSSLTDWKDENCPVKTALCLGYNRLFHKDNLPTKNDIPILLKKLLPTASWLPSCHCLLLECAHLSFSILLLEKLVVDPKPALVKCGLKLGCVVLSFYPNQFKDVHRVLLEPMLNYAKYCFKSGLFREFCLALLSTKRPGSALKHVLQSYPQWDKRTGARLVSTLASSVDTKTMNWLMSALNDSKGADQEALFDAFHLCITNNVNVSSGVLVVHVISKFDQKHKLRGKAVRLLLKVVKGRSGLTRDILEECFDTSEIKKSVRRLRKCASDDRAFPLEGLLCCLLVDNFSCETDTVSRATEQILQSLKSWYNRTDNWSLHALNSIFIMLSSSYSELLIEEFSNGMVDHLHSADIQRLITTLQDSIKPITANSDMSESEDESDVSDAESESADEECQILAEELQTALPESFLPSVDECSDASNSQDDMLIDINDANEDELARFEEVASAIFARSQMKLKMKQNNVEETQLSFQRNLVFLLLGALKKPQFFAQCLSQFIVFCADNIKRNDGLFFFIEKHLLSTVYTLKNISLKDEDLILLEKSVWDVISRVNTNWPSKMFTLLVVRPINLLNHHSREVDHNRLFDSLCTCWTTSITSQSPLIPDVMLSLTQRLDALLKLFLISASNISNISSAPKSRLESLFQFINKKDLCVRWSLEITSLIKHVYTPSLPSSLQLQCIEISCRLISQNNALEFQNIYQYLLSSPRLKLKPQSLLNSVDRLKKLLHIDDGSKENLPQKLNRKRLRTSSSTSDSPQTKVARC